MQIVLQRMENDWFVLEGSVWQRQPAHANINLQECVRWLLSSISDLNNIRNYYSFCSLHLDGLFSINHHSNNHWWEWGCNSTALFPPWEACHFFRAMSFKVIFICLHLFCCPSWRAAFHGKLVLPGTNLCFKDWYLTEDLYEIFRYLVSNWLQAK